VDLLVEAVDIGLFVVERRVCSFEFESEFGERGSSAGACEDVDPRVVRRGGIARKRDEQERKSGKGARQLDA